MEARTLNAEKKECLILKDQLYEHEDQTHRNRKNRSAGSTPYDRGILQEDRLLLSLRNGDHPGPEESEESFRIGTEENGRFRDSKKDQPIRSFGIA